MIKFTLLFLLIGVLSLVGSGEPTAYASQLFGIEIAEKYHLHVKGTPSTEDIVLPQRLTGPYWGLTQAMLKRAGYDLSSFAGQSVSTTKYHLEEKYYQKAFSETTGYEVSLWVFSKGPMIIGAYVSNKSPDGPIPGIYAINDPNIKLP